MIVLVSFIVSLTQTRVPRGEETTLEKLPKSDCPVGMSVGYFLDCWLMYQGLAHSVQAHFSQTTGIFVGGGRMNGQP